MSSQTHTRPNYNAIFLTLFVLTIVEIFVANLSLSKGYIILILVSLALLKAGLVGAFYMHLRFEKILLTLVLVGPLVFSFILALAVGFDIGHPRP